MSDKVNARIFINGKLLVRLLTHVPRVGDEIRMGENSYHKVTQVIWCYDEEGAHERVNIGTERVVESESGATEENDS